MYCADKGGMQLKPVLMHIPLKAWILGSTGAILLSAASVYIALSYGLLPWTLILASILSTLAFYSRASHIHAINFTHTIMTAGSMIGGAIAFIIPVFWHLHLTSFLSWHWLIILGISAIILSLIVSFFIQKTLVHSSFSFPVAYSTQHVITTLLNSSKNAQSSKRSLSTGFASSTLFTICRDYLNYIPTTIAHQNLLASPLLVSLGYLIGMPALIWGSSAAIGYTLTSVLHMWNNTILQYLGLGCIVGASLSLLCKSLWQSASLWLKYVRSYWWQGMLLAFFIIEFFIAKLLFSSYVPIAGIILVFSVFITFISSVMVAQSGINPFEILATLLILTLLIFIGLPPQNIIYLIFFLSVVAALTGDAINDYKTALTFDTPPKIILLAEGWGALIGFFSALLTFWLITQKPVTWGQAPFFAPQSFNVAHLIQQDIIIWPLLIAAVIAFLTSWYIPFAFMIGLGLYLPHSISMTVALGGLLSIVWSNKNHPTSNLFASGIFGGESITSMALALIRIIL